ncbi:MAG: signal peptidase I [Actinomycetia bacterium]|nr:signal peptidase I [Actinomycetes bacterium]
MLKIVVLITIVLLLFTVVYGLHYHTGPEMYPALKDGDLVLYSRLATSYRAGDLVVMATQGHTQVLRAIALPSDKVDVTEEGLIINDALVQEPDIYQDTLRYTTDIDFPLIVGSDEVFVLGDARQDATDSRVFGPVKTDDIQGVAITALRRRAL